MKAKLLLSAGMLFIAASASAQFVDDQKSNGLIVGGSETTSDLSSYNAFYFQYNPQTMYFEDDDEGGANGYLFGYTHGSALSSSSPIFLEAGLAFQYAKYDEDKGEFSFFDIRIPLNLSYRYQIPNSKFTLAPYLGLTAKINISGECDKLGGTKIKNGDFFDSDDMGDSDNTANRLQLAWQIGLNADISNFRIGIGYGKDLTQYMDNNLFSEMKFGSLNLTLGYCF